MNKNSENIILGISIGDMNGVGPEVVLKTFEDSRMLEFCTPVVFANAKIISFLKKQYGLTLNIQGIDKLDQIVPNKFNVINTWKEGVNLGVGQLDDNVGRYALKSFEAATLALKENKIDVLVTAPIHKYNIQSDTFAYKGHTDYLNEKLNGEALMFMVHEDVKVALVTDHVPVSELKTKITIDLIVSKINQLNASLVKDFKINAPKIAVLGINPHCGDNGVIGEEDEQLTKPAIQQAFKSGVLTFGPFAADGFFGSGMYRQFDAVLAMYHDQGLIPFKTLSFGEGVNYTAGLDRVRTSPDHGTGFDIAGKNCANETSFRNAVYAAVDVYHSRLDYQELVSNSLKVSDREVEIKK